MPTTAKRSRQNPATPAPSGPTPAVAAPTPRPKRRGQPGAGPLTPPLPIERLWASPPLLGAMALRVQPAPDGRQVAYLKPADDDRFRLDLWLFDRDSGLSRCLIDTSRLDGGGELSAAEQARRERQRSAGFSGVGEYQWSPDARQILFMADGALHLARLQGAEPPQLQPLMPAGEELIDPRLSPRGRFVAFVRGQNLHVLNLKTLRVRQLTFDGGGTVFNGEAEFVAQEELDRSRGHWWAPDESMIAFQRFDEAQVPVQLRFEMQAGHAGVVPQRYPVTGGPNVAVSLGLVAPAGGEVQWVSLGRQRDIYLARVDWLPDSRHLSYQRLSRDQKTLDLRLVNIATGRQRSLCSNHASSWVDLHSDLHFLQRQPAFIWADDRDGRKHLELVGLDGQRRHALTAGPWQVDDLLAVDEAGGWVYLSGDQGQALEKHVWRVRLDGSTASQPERLSEPGFWHEASFAGGTGAAQLWVDTENNPGQPPRTRVRDEQGRHLAWIEENRLDANHPYQPYLAQHVQPRYGSLPADDGTLLNYSLLLPPGFNPKRSHPAVVQVYGGPGAQLVTRQWPMGFDQALAQRGFVVFRLDNRGTARRGRAFSDVLLGEFGQVEVRDQLQGLAWLKQQPGIDAQRVGVMGWSYGGYMVLKLLTSPLAPGAFATGIAVAPSTRYELYDTAYTERYLGTPQANPEGYRRTSVMPDLPALKTPLLLVHGMADDNVLFTHSTEVMAALQAQGTPFRFMAYPGGKHGLSGRSTSTHAYRMFADHFTEMLRPDEHRANRH